MSSLVLDGEEYMEEFESLVCLLKEKVEKLKRNQNITYQMLEEFMPEYINIEDKIIKLILAPPTTNINHAQMDELLNTSNVYLRNFQDTWEIPYWEVYDHWYSKMFDVSLPPNHREEDNQSLEDKDMLDLSLELKGKNLDKLTRGRDKSKNSTAHEESLNISTSNINKIDEELNEIKEIDFTKNYKEEKKRGCLDNCLIF
jgi:hypothetical protein